MNKRILSAVLCVVMLLGCTASVFAASPAPKAASSEVQTDPALGAARTKISSVKLAYTSTAYTGKALKPAVTVKAKVSGKTKTLKKNTDYTVTYKNNKNAGTATVKVTGKGKYKGTISKTFRIKAVSLSSVKVSGSSFVYTGEAQKPAVTVKAKVAGSTKTLKSGTDYTVSYQNNKAVGKATVTVKGKGNYTGTKTANFTISPVEVTSVKIAFDRMLYTGCPMTQSNLAEVRANLNGSDKLLTEGQDYQISYENNTEAGTATMVVKGMGSFSGQATAQFEICDPELIDPAENWDLYDSVLAAARDTDDAQSSRILLQKAEDLLAQTETLIPIFYYDDPGTYFLAFNVKAPLFAGLSVQQAEDLRRAIGLLIDRNKNAALPYEGIGDPATTIVPVGMKDGKGNILHESAAGGYYPTAPQPDEARAILENLGYRFGEDGKLSEETPLSFEYLYNDNGYNDAIAENIAADLDVLGIKMAPAVVEWDALQNTYASGSFVSARYGWIPDNGAIGMLEIAESSNVEDNIMQLGR